MLIHKKAIYSKFVSYVRDVSSGRRVVTIGNVLEFFTRASEEPPLGFGKTPQIKFPVTEVRESWTTDVVENSTKNRYFSWEARWSRGDSNKRANQIKLESVGSKQK